MKKNKLKLNELAVKSFVTAEAKAVIKVKGGGTHYGQCSFDPCYKTTSLIFYTRLGCKIED